MSQTLCCVGLPETVTPNLLQSFFGVWGGCEVGPIKQGSCSVEFENEEVAKEVMAAQEVEQFQILSKNFEMTWADDGFIIVDRTDSSEDLLPPAADVPAALTLKEDITPMVIPQKEADLPKPEVKSDSTPLHSKLETPVHTPQPSSETSSPNAAEPSSSNVSSSRGSNLRERHSMYKNKKSDPESPTMAEASNVLASFYILTGILAVFTLWDLATGVRV